MVYRSRNSGEAQQFLSRGAAVIVRMRGLPYDCTPERILQIQFFEKDGPPEKCVSVMDGEDGILFVNRADGRSTGDAFVLFTCEADGQRALSKHKEIIGTRYIELFRSTTAEVNQVISKNLEPPKPAVTDPGQLSLESLERAAYGQWLATSPAPMHIPQPQGVVISGNIKDFVRLRGLPFEAQVEHVVEFLGDFFKHIVLQGVHMVFNAQGQPTGEAFIQMDSEAAAAACAAERHNKYMQMGKKQRYIEVFQCCADDMNLVLTAPTPSPIPTYQVNTQQRMVSPMLYEYISATPQLLPSPVLGTGQIPISLPQMGLLPAPGTITADGLINLSPHFLPYAPAPAGWFSEARPVHPGLMYWPFRTPPLSPGFYSPVNSMPAVLLLRNVPATVTTTDVMQFFAGYDILPESIVIQRDLAGRPTGDMVVQFASRQDADRASIERAGQLLAGSMVEIIRV